MSFFCTNCGTKVTKGNFCPNCGTPMNAEGAPVQEARVERVNGYADYPVKHKPPGSGLSTSGMVLGIIAASFLLCNLIGLFAIKDTYFEMVLDSKNLDYPKPLFAVSYVLVAFICGVIGMSLSIPGMVKHKSAKNITGLILSVLSIIGAVIVLFVVLAILG